MKTADFGFNVRKRLPDVFDIVDDCFALSDIIITNVSNRNIKKIDFGNVQAIYLSNYYKATESLISASKLADAGLSGDLQTICRKILEQVINLKYMSLDLNVRAPKFWHHSSIELMRFINYVLNNDNYDLPLKTSMTKLLPEANIAYANAIILFEKDEAGNILKKYKKNWSGLNLSEMAEKCGLVNDYIYCYKIFSERTHVKMGNMADYFDLEREAFGPTHKLSMVMKVLLEVLRLYLILTGLVIESFQIELKDSISSLHQRIDKLQGDPRLSDETRITEL